MNYFRIFSSAHVLFLANNTLAVETVLIFIFRLFPAPVYENEQTAIESYGGGKFK